MKNFNVYKKRDGQEWKPIGEYFCSNFEEAKKEFAQNCWNDLLNGKHGDNFNLFTQSDKDEFDFITEGKYRDWETDRKSTRLNSSHSAKSRMPSSA